MSLATAVQALRTRVRFLSSTTAGRLATSNTALPAVEATPTTRACKAFIASVAVLAVVVLAVVSLVVPAAGREHRAACSGTGLGTADAHTHCPSPQRLRILDASATPARLPDDTAAREAADDILHHDLSGQLAGAGGVHDTREPGDTAAVALQHHVAAPLQMWMAEKNRGAGVLVCDTATLTGWAATGPLAYRFDYRLQGAVAFKGAFGIIQHGATAEARPLHVSYRIERIDGHWKLTGFADARTSAGVERLNTRLDATSAAMRTLARDTPLAGNALARARHRQLLAQQAFLASINETVCSTPRPAPESNTQRTFSPTSLMGMRG